MSLTAEGVQNMGYYKKLFTSYSRNLSILTIICASLVLFGWSFNISFFKSLGFNFVTIKGNTAILFILSATSLLLVLDGKKHSGLYKTGMVISAVVIIFSILNILEYTMKKDFGIDQLFFRDTVDAFGTINPGRLAPNSALNFIFAGIAILLIDARNKVLFSFGRFFNLAGGLITLLALTGYCYGVSMLYGMELYTKMALYSVIIFSFLFSALICARPDRGIMDELTNDNPGGVMLRNSIPLIILILFFLGLIRVIGERNGLYDSYFGAALFTVIRIFIFIALTFIISNTLNKLDLMRKQKEKELMESETKYNNIKDVDDLKSQFIAIVSHELRTPITIIKGFASFLAKGAAGEINQQQKEYAESIGLNANRLSKLVAEMVDISKIESGTFTIEKQAVAMKDLISSCVQELRYIADKSNIRLTEKNELPELVLFADKGRLEQAFTNLLNNGIKFSLYGSEILIGLKTADMSKIAKIEGWTPDEEKTYVLIYVRDTGCGVAPENIEKIFDRFFQAEDHKTRKYQGMGLGLSITKSIIEAHGGAIWCESEGINKGTVFYILLPE